MLNWRRDPDHERRINAKLIEIEQIKRESEQIERESEQIMREAEQIEREAEQIKNATEQLKRENARLKALNARTRHLISCVDQLCFPPESSSNPVTSTEPDSTSFLP
jgi:predicted  nucleic acid-binding Zn-ribbon protein